MKHTFDRLEEQSTQARLPRRLSQDRGTQDLQRRGLSSCSRAGALSIAWISISNVPREAFQDYLGHLSDDGVVSILMGDAALADGSLPPPLLTRLALIVREALERGACRM